MRPWVVVCVSAIWLSASCSAAPQSTTSSSEQSAEVSKDQATVIMDRAKMTDASIAEPVKEQPGQSETRKTPPKAPMTYRQGLKKIARDLGEKR